MSQTMRVLIVDDHALVRDGVRALLSGQPGITVIGEAGNAAEARAAASKLAPDLVLMDVGMNGIDGIALTREFAGSQPGMAVLVLSMYDNADYVHQALQAGARGYVLKDAPSGELLEAMATVGAGESFLSPALAARIETAAPSRALLSAREQEILQHLARGLSSRQIAERLAVSVRTVETHRQNIRRKLDIEGQAELIRYAVESCRPAGSA